MKKKWTALLLILAVVFSQPFTVWASGDTTGPVTEADTISGVYPGTFNVTLTSNEPGTIYYTLDGSVPTATNHAGSGPDTGTVVPVSGFYTELRYRAVDTAGNWEYPNTEFYKIAPADAAATAVIPGTDRPNPDDAAYYTNYVHADGGNLVYARKLYSEDSWGYKEVHLIKEGVDTAITDVLTREVTFTGISGDHVIYGNNKEIVHYSISSGEPAAVYTSTMMSPDIAGPRIYGNRVIFFENNKVKVLDIRNVEFPQVMELDGDSSDNAYSFDSFDLYGNKAVWEEGGNIYLADLDAGTHQPILPDMDVDRLILADDKLYYADEDALYEYVLAGGSTNIIADNLSYYSYAPMEIDQTQKTYILFNGYHDLGGWIGILNLSTGVVKYLDFDGEYSDLASFAIRDGVVYWTKEHLYFDEAQFSPTNSAIYIYKSPLYAFDLDNLPADAAAPTVNANPNTNTFGWDGAVRFDASEEVRIRFTLDGTEPSSSNGYSATLMDKAPIFRESVQINFNAVDFAGNPLSTQSSGTYTLTKQPALPIGGSDEWYDVVMAGSSIVYKTWSAVEDTERLYVYDIPTQRSTLLDDDFSGYDLQFDGRYIVYEVGGWFEGSTILYFDLATGQSGTVAAGSTDFYADDGRVVYVTSSDTGDGISVYDLATMTNTVLDVSFITSGDIDDPRISDNLVVFEDYDHDKFYLYRLDTGELSALAPPGTYEINSAMPADDKVMLIGDDEDKLFVYDAVSDSYTDLTAVAGNGAYDDLSADKLLEKQVAFNDYNNQKSIVYNTESGSMTSVGSGQFYSGNPLISGNTLVVSGNFGLPIPEQLYIRQLAEDNDPPQVTVTPAAGSYNAVQTVTISVYGEAASIFHTLDGSTPTTDSHPYYGPIELDQNATLKYLAVDNAGNETEDTINYVFDYTAPTVTAAPPGGSYSVTQAVYLTSDETSTIYYSVDGSDPSVTYAVYEQTHGLTVSDNLVLKYKAVDTLGNESPVRTETYVIDPDSPVVSATPAGGLYHGDITVTLSGYDAESAVDVFYTLDGTEPDVSSAMYSSPFTLSQTSTLKYFAQDAVGNRTATMRVDYEIVKIPPTATVTPADGSTKVDVNAAITAVFDADVTLHNAAGITMMQGDQPVSGVTAALSGRELTLSHGALEKGKLYRVTVAADTVRNVHGVGNNEFEWSFTTEYALPQGTLSPADEAFNVALNAPVAVTFAQVVNAVSLSVITIAGQNGEPVGGVHASLTDKILSIAHDAFRYGTTYKVTIPPDAVRNADGTGNAKIEWSFTTASQPTAYIPPQTPGEDHETNEQGLIKLADNALEVTESTTADDRVRTEVQINTDRLADALGSVKDKKKQEQIVVLELKKAGDIAAVNVPAEAFAGALADSPDAILSIRTGDASYELPISLLNLAPLKSEFGDELTSATIRVMIEKVPDSQAGRIADSAEENKMRVLGDSVEFTLTVEVEGKTKAINDFGNMFVSRTITVPSLVEGSTASAVLYDPATGKFSFVPAVFTTEIGKTKVIIMRNGNSIYTVVSANKSFADIAGHWAQADIELLASKLLVSGKSETTFAPDSKITRAEFAALLVRALGLTASDANAERFSDVNAGDWFAGAVGTAAKAGLVSGFHDGTFRPHDRITRQQMAAMIFKALAFAGKTDLQGKLETLPARFTDGGAISNWAASGVAVTVEAGILQGRKDGTFGPTEMAARAEAASMLKRFLQYIGFINK